VWSRWFWPRREKFVRAWSGLPVPAAARVISKQKLSLLVAAAERDQLGWDEGDLSVRERDVFLLVPYAYEEHPVQLWKCRVLAFAGGFAVEVTSGRKISLARLDVRVDSFRRLPAASRKVERQLLNWLAWKVAAAEWKNVGGGRSSHD
jgi:hypothetical protein